MSESVAFIKVRVNGTEYAYEPSTVTLNEGIKVQKRTGLLYPEFAVQLVSNDLVAWKALCALLVERTSLEINYDGFDAVWDEVEVTLVKSEDDASDPSSRPDETATAET